MISFNKKFIFIHIPKCGGTSMEKFILDNIDSEAIETKHFTIDRYKSVYNNIGSYFKFCLIRDPYERFLSLYNYFCGGSEMWKNKSADSDVSIIDFALRLAEGKPFTSGRAWPAHYKTQYSFVNNDCDLILKLEDINKGIETLKRKLNCPLANFPQVNISKKKPPARFTREVCEVINDIYDIDFKAFGYTKK